MVFQVHKVRTEEDDRRKTRAGDRVSLGYRLHRVSHRVEFVSDRPHPFGKPAHDRYTPRVVGNRSEGIERDDDSRHCQHGHDCHGNSIKTCSAMAYPN